MTYSQVVRRRAFWGGAGVLALVISGILGAEKGLAGMALGLASAAFGILGLRLMIGLLERSAGQGRPGSTGVSLSVFAFALKVPMYWICGVLAQRIGGQAFNCFLGGIVLVYSSTVVWAAAADPDTPHSPNGSPVD